MAQESCSFDEANDGASGIASHSVVLIPILPIVGSLYSEGGSLPPAMPVVTQRDLEKGVLSCINRGLLPARLDLPGEPLHR